MPLGGTKDEHFIVHANEGNIIMVTTSIILTGEIRWLWNSSWIPLLSAPLTKMQKLYVSKKLLH